VASADHLSLRHHDHRVSGSIRLEGRPAELLQRKDFEELFLGAGTNLAAQDDTKMEEI
jgi:hypothetical protein